MKKDKWLILGVASLIITLFLGATLWYRQKERAESEAKIKAQMEKLIRPYSPVQGPDTAPVTIVEFFDPECEACRMLYPLVKEMLAKYPGKVRLVLRYMPLHGNAAYAAGILEGARRQGKYWEALEVILERQPEWGSHHAPKPELLPVFIKEMGLDVAAVLAAAQDSEILSRVKQDHEDGISLGVNRTPTFFVNGKRLERISPEDFSAAIEAALK